MQIALKKRALQGKEEREEMAEKTWEKCLDCGKELKEENFMLLLRKEWGKSNIAGFLYKASNICFCEECANEIIPNKLGFHFCSNKYENRTCVRCHKNIGLGETVFFEVKLEGRFDHDVDMGMPEEEDEAWICFQGIGICPECYIRKWAIKLMPLR